MLGLYPAKIWFGCRLNKVLHIIQVIFQQYVKGNTFEAFQTEIFDFKVPVQNYYSSPKNAKFWGLISSQTVIIFKNNLEQFLVWNKMNENKGNLKTSILDIAQQILQNVGS